MLGAHKNHFSKLKTLLNPSPNLIFSLPDRTGVASGDLIMSYKSFAQDITNAVHWVHTEGSMKLHVLQNLERYVIRDERIKRLLPQLRLHGAQTFLLTNSEYSYTNVRLFCGCCWVLRV